MAWCGPCWGTRAPDSRKGATNVRAAVAAAEAAPPPQKVHATKALSTAGDGEGATPAPSMATTLTFLRRSFTNLSRASPVPCAQDSELLSLSEPLLARIIGHVRGLDRDAARLSCRKLRRVADGCCHHLVAAGRHISALADKHMQLMVRFPQLRRLALWVDSPGLDHYRLPRDLLRLPRVLAQSDTLVSLTLHGMVLPTPLTAWAQLLGACPALQSLDLCVRVVYDAPLAQQLSTGSRSEAGSRAGGAPRPPAAAAIAIQERGISFILSPFANSGNNLAALGSSGSLARLASGNAGSVTGTPPLQSSTLSLAAADSSMHGANHCSTMMVDAWDVFSGLGGMGSSGGSGTFGASLTTDGNDGTISPLSSPGRIAGSGGGGALPMSEWEMAMEAAAAALEAAQAGPPCLLQAVVRGCPRLRVLRFSGEACKAERENVAHVAALTALQELSLDSVLMGGHTLQVGSCPEGAGGGRGDHWLLWGERMRATCRHEYAACCPPPAPLLTTTPSTPRGACPCHV